MTIFEAFVCEVIGGLIVGFFLRWYDKRAQK